ncbi:MAG: FKBP-type peptidyl-prolyl cis-trans isomerase [Deltaproteobacteria bacterium]|nr:FKBP-type peptidyl-prolyl cis-trans isomerase [Deltaproteobacteria bacterium]
MKKILLTLCVCSAVALTACNKKQAPGATAPGKLETDQQRYSYALGYQFGANIAQLGVDLDNTAITNALNDALSKKDSLLSEKEIQESMVTLRNKRMEAQKARAEKGKAEGAAFLEKNKTAEGVKVTESGLQYKILKEGTGKTPKVDDRVKVHYKGNLIDGTEFDSSYKRDAPAIFGVGGVIKGWTEALQLMKEGAQWRLFIPSELAYGEMDRPTIPGNSVLIFDVELISIENEEEESK